MSQVKWMIANKITQQQWNIAVGLLHNGGTHPTFRAIRKTLARLKRGDKNYGMWHGWRNSPRVQS
jgi:hypothetical protein